MKICVNIVVYVYLAVNWVCSELYALWSGRLLFLLLGWVMHLPVERGLHSATPDGAQRDLDAQ